MALSSDNDVIVSELLTQPLIIPENVDAHKIPDL